MAAIVILHLLNQKTWFTLKMRDEIFFKNYIFTFYWFYLHEQFFLSCQIYHTFTIKIVTVKCFIYYNSCVHKGKKSQTFLRILY